MYFSNKKFQIYKIVIRPIITFAHTVINTKDKENLHILKRKILRSVLGRNVTRDRERRLKLNKELEKKLGEENIVRHI